MKLNIYFAIEEYVVMNLFMKGPRFSKGHSIKIQSLTFPPSLAFINEKDVKLCVLTLCRPVFS